MREERRGETPCSDATGRTQRLARVGSWEYDPAGRHFAWSPEMLRIFGLPEDGEAPSEEGLLRMIHADDRERFQQATETAIAGGSGYDMELRILPSAGPAAWLRLLCETERAPDGRVGMLHGVAQDITDRKTAEAALSQSNAKLRSLAVHLLSAREEERKKVAQEIHDELGQVLTALVMDLQWLDTRLGRSPKQVKEKMRGILELADHTIRTVQRISAELRPRMLDDLGLAAALEWLAGDFQRRMQIPCRVEVAVTESRIGGNAATTIFRIVQEALTNVARHSRARHVEVRLVEKDNALLLTVRDDGVGITEEQAGGPASFGLIGLRERVKGLDGTLAIHGEPGEGTVLSATIPFPGTGGLA